VQVSVALGTCQQLYACKPLISVLKLSIAVLDKDHSFEHQGGFKSIFKP